MPRATSTVSILRSSLFRGVRSNHENTSILTVRRQNRVEHADQLRDYFRRLYRRRTVSYTGTNVQKIITCLCAILHVELSYKYGVSATHHGDGIEMDAVSVES